MLKRIFGAAALVSMAVTTGCVKPYVADLHFDYSGEWTLRWVKSDSRHPVSLAQKDNQLAGIYTNTNDESCTISGKENTRRVLKLKIECPGWAVKIKGAGSQNGTAVSGRYKQIKGFFKPIGEEGDFVMLKNKPAVAAANEKKGG
jgi:hypothetical protein